jgi:hypothetical protein
MRNEAMLSAAATFWSCMLLRRFLRMRMQRLYLRPVALIQF